MKKHPQGFLRSRVGLAVVISFGIAGRAAAAQDLAFQFDPQHTAINFTLGDVLHTVRGSFQLTRGSLHFVPTAGKLSGEVVVNARSGQSGNAMRDRKMHSEVLESDRYAEIIFRPDRVEGNVAPQGKSPVQVYGIFSIHGSDHEITIPAEVEMSSDHWNATLHFAVPYAKWGMKNPSTLFLRVNDSVAIDVTASGRLAQP